MRLLIPARQVSLFLHVCLASYSEQNERQLQMSEMRVIFLSATKDDDRSPIRRPIQCVYVDATAGDVRILLVCSIAHLRSNSPATVAAKWRAFHFVNSMVCTNQPSNQPRLDRQIRTLRQRHGTSSEIKLSRSRPSKQRGLRANLPRRKKMHPPMLSASRNRCRFGANAGLQQACSPGWKSGPFRSLEQRHGPRFG